MELDTTSDMMDLPPSVNSVTLLEKVRHSKNMTKPNRVVIGAVSDTSSQSRSELDSHANMIVLGKDSLCLTPQGKKMARVAAFSPTLQPMDIPVVDACIKWNDPLTGKDHFLLFEDALYVEQMEHNLLPPFLLREAGWFVNDTARIHTHCPTEFTHSLVLEHPTLPDWCVFILRLFEAYLERF